MSTLAKTVPNGTRLFPAARTLAGSPPPRTEFPATEVIESFATAQKTAFDVLGAYQSELAQWDDAAKCFVITRSLGGENGVSDRRVAAQDIPWISSRVFRGEVIHFARGAPPSEEAVRDVHELFCSEPEFATVIPLNIREQVLGFLCCHAGTESGWPERSSDQTGFLADVLSSLLARKRFDSDLIRTLEEEANERFQSLLNLFPAAVVLTNAEGVILHLSSRTTDAFCYTRDELIKKSIELLVPQWFREAYTKSNQKLPIHADAGRSNFPRVLYGVRKDGSTFPAEITKAPIRIKGVLLFLNAITDTSYQTPLGRVAGGMHLQDDSQSGEVKRRLERDGSSLTPDIQLVGNHVGIVGHSQAIQSVLADAEKVADTDSSVLILGETGTGKELIARTIHRNSKREARSLVNVNCAALPASLVENELFGRERGAYTGALTREVGRFELADRSTIFLDEIGELPLELQAKLLRVLQEGEFERLGSSKTITVNVRVVAATSRDLEAAVKDGRFRDDLFYRLNVFPIHVPPLRERREDILPLTWSFLRELSGKMGRNIEAVQAQTMEAFQSYAWPGNVRELHNVIERNLIVHPGPVFKAELPPEAATVVEDGSTIEALERNHVCRVLERTGWRIRGLTGAAKILGLKPTTLEARMKKLGIVRKP